MARNHGVIVCGGGLTGVAAAVGAARMGINVLLVERYGFLGGMATNGLVQPFMTYRAGGKEIICGIFQEILERLKKKNALKDGHIFDSEVMKLILDELVLESNVNLLLHTFVANVEVKGNSLTGIYVENKSGREKIEAKVFVDATGDGDIAARSGTPFDKGRRKDKLMQPMTLSFRMGNVNRSKMPDRNTINEIYLRAKERGEISNPREDVLWFNTPRDEVIHFNTTRVIKRDSTDADDLTAAEIEGRKQVWKMVNFLKNHVLGFENSYLLMIAPQIGPRESRRIIGEYIMTANDIVEARKFSDVVARGSYGIDIHNPAGTGTDLRYLKPGTSYDIPYRSLIPLRIDRLLMAGRCISSTHEAHSAIRIMPICTAIGHAAGVAAAITVRKNAIPRKLMVTDLQRELLNQKANLGDNKIGT